LRIVVCVKFFENEITIERMLYSITHFADKLVAIDGAYEGFSNHCKSKDKTVKKIEYWRDNYFHKPVTLVHFDIKEFFKNEMEKRNLMFKEYFYSEGDWILFLDSDEWLIGDVFQKETRELLETTEEPYFLNWFYQRWNTIPLNEKKRNFWKYDENTSTLGKRQYMRLFRFTPGIRVIGNHWTIMYPSLKHSKYFFKTAETAPLKIMHEPEKSNPKLIEQKEKYNFGERMTQEKRIVSARDLLESGELFK